MTVRGTFEVWRALTRIPSDPDILEAHRQTVLGRTRTAGWVAAVVIPVTVLWYFVYLEPASRAAAGIVTFVALMAVMALIAGLRLSFFQRNYHLGFFILV